VSIVKLFIFRKIFNDQLSYVSTFPSNTPQIVIKSTWFSFPIKKVSVETFYKNFNCRPASYCNTGSITDDLSLRIYDYLFFGIDDSSYLLAGLSDREITDELLFKL